MCDDSARVERGKHAPALRDLFISTGGENINCSRSIIKNISSKLATCDLVMPGVRVVNYTKLRQQNELISLVENTRGNKIMKLFAYREYPKFLTVLLLCTNCRTKSVSIFKWLASHFALKLVVVFLSSWYDVSILLHIILLNRW